MAEQTEEKKSGIDFKAILKLAIGVVLVVLGIALWIIWFKDFLKVVMGCIGPFLILAGAITIAIARE